MRKSVSFRNILVSTTIVGIAVLALAGPATAADRYSDLPVRPTDPTEAKLWQQQLPGGGSGTVEDAGDNRAQVYFSDRALFDATAPGLPLEDFEAGAVGAGGVVTCSDPFDSTTTDACWSAGDILGGISLGSSSGGGMVILGPGFLGAHTIVTGANTFLDFTYVDFAPAVTAIGMDLIPAGGMTIRLFDAAGALLATTSATGSGDGAFWGVISDEAISRVEIEESAGGGEILDNLAFGVGGAALILGEVTFDDLCSSGDGEGNGIAEPNELLELYLEVSAVGGDFTGVTGTITSVSAGATIAAGTYNYGTITDGSSETNAMPFQVILGSMQCGDTLDVQITVTSNENAPVIAALATSVGQALAPVVPVDIPDDDPLGISSSLIVGDDVTLTDLNVFVQIDHTWVGDLVIWLESPSGTTVALLDQPGVPAGTFGCGDNNLAITFDDASAFDPEDYCTGSDPWYSGDAMPVGSLAAFNGESTAGEWLLWVSDNAGGDTGQIVDWQLITDPIISGVCIPCAENVPVQTEAIPTLGWMGILALIALLGCVGVFFIRRF